MSNTEDAPAAKTDLAIRALCTRLSELRDALREAAANDAAARELRARLEAVALRLDRLIETLATAAGGGPNPVGSDVLVELRAACRDAAGLQLAKDPNALEALVRAVGDAVDRISLAERAPAGSGRAWGTIKWFNEVKGFGFITPDGGGEDLFAHFSAIEMKGFKTLKEGQRVQFEVTTGPKGKQASNIQANGGDARLSEKKSAKTPTRGAKRKPGEQPPATDAGERLARADEVTMETLYPDLRPSDLHPLAGSVLTVDVSLSPAEVEGTSGEVHITREAPDVVRVLKVHLLSDKSSQWDTLEYSISAGTQKPAHFVLTAPTVDEPDHSILELRANFYLNNRWCGEGVRNLDVRRDAGVSALARIPSPKVPEWRLGLTLEPDATPPDLIVRILKTTHVGEYDWSCLSPHLNLDTPVDPVKRTMALGDDAQTYVRNRFQPLAGKSLANIDIADIEGIGQAIYDSTPEVFKDAYWALWSAANEGHFPFDSIQIVTDEPYIPWELMRVYDAKRAPDVDPEFLAVRHCIGRWLAMDAARLTQHISVNATAVAASDYSQVDSIADKLPWAAEEKKLMMDTYRAEEVVLKSDPLLKFLKDGRVQALHFACHGKMSITNPLGSQLILEDTPNDLKPTMVNRPEVRRGLGSEHPMVFLNACEVGGGAASLTLVAGFPAAFLSAGASAVISPLWVVNDAHAKTIAATFYEQVLRKDARPLGEVLREVHSRWRDEKHLTYLAYVLYGDPLAAVAYRA